MRAFKVKHCSRVRGDRCITLLRQELVEEGKVNYVGVSEIDASTLRRAHAVCPITAYQMECSVFTRDVEEELVPTCRELEIGERLLVPSALEGNFQ